MRSMWDFQSALHDDKNWRIEQESHPQAISALRLGSSIMEQFEFRAPFSVDSHLRDAKL